MSRGFSEEMEAAAAATVTRPIVFVEMQYRTETYRCWSGVGTRWWNGHPWLGVGAYGSISNVEDSTDFKAPEVLLRLSGVDAEMIRVAATAREEYFMRPATVWLGYRHETTGAVIEEPVVIVHGTMDRLSHSEDGTTADFEMVVVDETASWDEPSAGRWTNEDQQRRHPGDRFCEYVPALQDVPIKFGDFRNPKDM